LKNGKAAGIDDFVNEYFKYMYCNKINNWTKILENFKKPGTDPGKWSNIALAFVFSNSKKILVWCTKENLSTPPSMCM
jgi:hypothetical protein